MIEDGDFTKFPHKVRLGNTKGLKSFNSIERFYSNGKLSSKFKQNKIRGQRPTVLHHDEPLILLLDTVMNREGITDKRLENALGVGKGRVKEWRKHKQLFNTVHLIRQALWLCGYELTMGVTKRANASSQLALFRRDIMEKAAQKIFNVREGEWKRRKMWNVLDMSDLPEELEGETDIDLSEKWKNIFDDDGE